MKIRLKGFIRQSILIAIFSVSTHAIHSEQLVNIYGLIDWAEYNPRTGVPYTNQQCHSTFVVTLSETSFKICLTNLSNDADWSLFAFDGTNGYTLNPMNENAVDGKTNSASVLGSVEPSARYLPPVYENLGVSSVWMAYALNPQLVAINNDSVELPLAGGSPRTNPKVYGYRWDLKFSANQRFVSQCKIVRDQKLDLDNKNELLRPEMNYPDTLADYDQVLVNLSFRKSIPSGFLLSDYKVVQWYRTNDLVIPDQAQFTDYLSPLYCARPYRIVLINATNIVLNSGEDPGQPEISVPTLVEDYRYKKSNKTRIFKYAQYTLNTGDSWKSGNDPQLLAEADHWLKHGRRYDDFGQNRKRFFVWSLFALLISIPFLAMAFKNKAKK